MNQTKVISCYLGLGSNMADPLLQNKKAIEHLKTNSWIELEKIASFYQSKPWGMKNQADFINTVVKIKTQLSPVELLHAIKHIEYNLMGRIKNDKWHSRIIDIDILLYGISDFKSDKLTIPHPYLSQRCFVIVPLMELKPPLPDTISLQIKQFSKNNDCKEQLIRL